MNVSKHLAQLCLVPLSIALLASSALADRPNLGPGETNWTPPGQKAGAVVAGIQTSYVQTAADLTECLLGRDINILSATYNGAPVAVGTFTADPGILGFITEGIILSTGNIATVSSAAGVNQRDDSSTNNGTPGYAPLDALIPGLTTRDAAVLQIQFECPDARDFRVDFAFASEEYNEFVNSQFNDVFAFFLNGVNITDNIAIVPPGCNPDAAPGIPVAINSVNCGNFEGLGYPTFATNCGCYRNNDCGLGGACFPFVSPINTEMDGLTEEFTASGTTVPGVNTITLAIADASDTVYDSNIFIRCSSFRCEDPTGTESGSWGEIKIRHGAEGSDQK